MSATLRGSEATSQRAAVLASSAGLTIGELVERALDEHERAGFWCRTREALAAQPGAELEDHDLFGRALSDNLEHS